MMFKDRTIVVACGVGRDSVAMTIQLKRLGIRPAAILFADVGSEKVGTYAYIPILRDWLKKVEFPDLTIVRYKPLHAPYTTIEGNMVMNATLPGATFNRGSCTLKFKVEPQNRWCRGNEDCTKAWARGEQVLKLIGFECDEQYRQKRAADKVHAGKGSLESKRYEYAYPLMDWGWDLKRCIDEIGNEGLPVPPKSACFMCPNQKPCEIQDLSPEERARVIRVELTAEPYNRKVHGLWRRPVKKSGTPGSITQYILDQGLPFMPLDELEKKDPMPLNPKCAKFKSGETFKPPHDAPSIVEMLKKHGHAVPEAEDKAHLEIISTL